MRRGRRQSVFVGALLALAATSLALLGNASPLFKELEWKTFDLRARAAADRSPPEELVVVLLDEATLRMMNPLVGRWPWPRSLHADVIDYLAMAGARAILLDILFTENEQQEGVSRSGISQNDLLLAQSSAAGDNVYHAFQLLHDSADEFNQQLLGRPLPGDFAARFAVGDSPDFLPSGNVFYLPIPEVQHAARGMGVVSFAPDSDGVYRRTRLLRNYQGELFPVLGLTPLTSGSDSTIRLLERHQLLLTHGEEQIAIPLQGDGSYLLRPQGRFETYSLSGILASIQQLRQGTAEELITPPELFTGKVIFIGASAAGIEDLKTTPLGQLTPGVFLHANIYANIVQRDFLRTGTALAAAGLALLLASLAAGGVLALTRPALQALLPATLFGAYAGSSFLAYSWGLLLPLVTPLTAGGLAWLGAYAWLSATEGRERKRIRRMLGQYVSPAILEEVLARPDGLLCAEIGRRERLTVLFSDIRGFTEMSENWPAEDVVEVLNGYFSGMVDIIFHHQGTLDKFIGDAILAFWGAPVQTSDHALQATTTALAMVRRLAVYNRELVDRGRPALAIGIGLHTGEVIIGNIGSEKKLDYTVIGDSVNLASRLEGLTKHYGCAVLISDSTRAELGGALLTRTVDRVRVKGKKDSVGLHEVLGSIENGSGMAASEDDRQLASLTEAGFAAYQARNWTAATEFYERVLQKREDRVGQLLLERCRTFRQNPPPSDWDGVHTMDFK